MPTASWLSPLAAGRWLVSKEWALESAEAGEWLPETTYELNDDADDDATRPFGKEGKGTFWMGAPRAHRLAREREDREDAARHIT